MSGSYFEASDEASERVNNARIGDVAFLVRSIVGQTMTSEDVSLLARVLTDVQSTSGGVRKPAVIERLMALGRSRDKAESLASAVIR